MPSLVALVGGAGRADRDARRILAVQARLREMHGLRVRVFADLEGLHAVEERAGGILAVRLEVGERTRRARRVPFLARRHAGVAADADVEVDDEGELGHRSFAASGEVRVPPRRRGAPCPALPAPPRTAAMSSRGSPALRRVDAHAHVVPRGLARDRVGVGRSGRSRRRAGSSSEIRWFNRNPRCDSLASGARRHAPCALPIAFQVQTVPGSTASEWLQRQRTLPHGDSTHIHAPSSMPAAQRDLRIDVEGVVRVDLSQPGVLRVPRVVHRHRPLRDRVERELREIGALRLQRLVIERQRIEVGLDPLAQVVGRLPRDPLALRREAELLEHFRVEMDQDRLGVALDPRALRPLEVALVPVAHVLVGRRQLVLEHAVVPRVHLPLPRIGLAAHELFAALAAPAGEEADARPRFRLVVDDEIRDNRETCACRRAGTKAGSPSRPAELDQHFLERLALAGRRDDRECARNRRGPRTRRSADRASTSRRAARDRSCPAARGRRRPSSPTGTHRRRRRTGSCTRRPRACRSA